jgi:hypothetical protein
MRHAVVFAVVVGSVCCGLAARADSEAPAAKAAAGHEGGSAAKADKAWPKLVEAFAKALVEGDRAGVEAAMGAKSYVRRFDSSEFEPVGPLLERANKSTLVGQHGYFHPALVMAADVAADFKNATAVPEKVRTLFMIDDPAEIKRGNATAVQWVVEQLEAKQGQPVAVIVLWSRKAAAAAAAEPVTEGNEKGEGKKQEQAVAFEPLFVLVRGEEMDPHKFRINYVVYGNPVPENE